MTSEWTPPRPSPTAADVEALPEILTRDQAAWLMRLTPGRLDAAAKRGDLPARLVGRSRRFSKSALLAVVAGEE